MRITFALVAVAAPPLLVGAEFWHDKEPSQWSATEIRQMVTDSPWAAQGDVIVPAGAVKPRVLVRWESAAPVIEACDKGGLEPHLYSCVSKIWSMAGLGAKFESARNDFYVISLSHYPKPIGGVRAPEHSPAAQAGLERFGAKLRETTVLKRAGKPPLSPDYVLVFPAGPTIRVQFFFPRSQEIVLEDEMLLFESVSEAVEVRSRFNLRKMIYKSVLEL
jgi:hypothetical protein